MNDRQIIERKILLKQQAIFLFEREMNDLMQELIDVLINENKRLKADLQKSIL
jgi:hypothetical protein